MNVIDQITGFNTKFNEKLYGDDKFTQNIVGKSFEGIAAAAVSALLSLVGVAFIVLMIYGGILWMVSRGEEENTKKALKLLVASVVGLIIVLAAGVIWNFVLDRILEPVIPTS